MILAALNILAAILHAVEKMAESYRVDGSKMKTSMLLQAAKANLPTRERTELTETMSRWVEELVERDDYQAAERILSAALATARKAKAAELVRMLVTRTKIFEAQRKAFEEVGGAVALLRKEPGNPDANLLVGRYYCLEKGQWSRGLPHLALGSEKSLSGLAGRDLAAPNSGTEQARLGDDWWARSDADEKYKEALRRRAVFWYRRSLRRLPQGLARLKVTKRIEESSAGAGPADETSLGLPRAAREGALRVQYKCGDGNATDNQIKPMLLIENRGRSTVSLNGLTLRYWYSRDSDKRQQFWCDHAKIGNGNVKGSFHELQRPTRNANSYLKITFAEGAGSLPPGSDSGPIHLRIANSDWSNCDESDDYSFDPQQTDYGPTARITLYRGDDLVWGTEPGR